MVVTSLQPLALPAACWPLHTARSCAMTCDPAAATWERIGTQPRLCTSFCHEYFNSCLDQAGVGFGAYPNSSVWCAVYGGESRCLDVPAAPPPLPPPPPPPPRAPPEPPAPPPHPPPPIQFVMPGWIPAFCGALGVLALLGVSLRLRFTWEKVQQAKEVKEAEAAQADVVPGVHPGGGFDGIEQVGVVDGAPTPRGRGSPSVGSSTARSGLSGLYSARSAAASSGGGGVTSRSCGGFSARSDGGVTSRSGSATERSSCTSPTRRLDPRGALPDFVIEARAATPSHQRLFPLPAGLPDPYGLPHDDAQYGADPLGLYRGVDLAAAHTHRGACSHRACSPQRQPPMYANPHAGAASPYVAAGYGAGLFGAQHGAATDRPRGMWTAHAPGWAPQSPLAPVGPMPASGVPLPGAQSMAFHGAPWQTMASGVPLAGTWGVPMPPASPIVQGALASSTPRPVHIAAGILAESVVPSAPIPGVPAAGVQVPPEGEWPSPDDALSPPQQLGEWPSPEVHGKGDAHDGADDDANFWPTPAAPAADAVPADRGDGSQPHQVL